MRKSIKSRDDAISNGALTYMHPDSCNYCRSNQRWTCGSKCTRCYPILTPETQRLLEDINIYPGLRKSALDAISKDPRPQVQAIIFTGFWREWSPKAVEYALVRIANLHGLTPRLRPNEGC